jgi:hypothetical protein
MAYPVFYVPSGDVLPIMFDSFDGGTGASITMSGLAVTDIEIYKDGSVTQRASDAGYTLLDTDGIDFDGITGIHGFSIDTGDNTDAGFYTVGAWFHVVVSTITVDAQTVSFIAAAFRLMPAESVAGKPKVDVDAFGGSAGNFASGRPEVNATHLAGQAITAAAGVTFPTSVASPTNITAGTITTVTNLTNAPTAGDFTATMKTSLNAATPASVVGAVGSVTAGVTVTTNNDKTGYRLSSTGVDDVLDEAVDGSTTLRESQRIQNSALAGKSSGHEAGTPVYRDLADSKDRITATTDANGNRTAVTTDAT